MILFVIPPPKTFCVITTFSLLFWDSITSTFTQATIICWRTGINPDINACKETGQQSLSPLWWRQDSWTHLVTKPRCTGEAMWDVFWFWSPPLWCRCRSPCLNTQGSHRCWITIFNVRVCTGVEKSWLLVVTLVYRGSWCQAQKTRAAWFDANAF